LQKSGRGLIAIKPGIARKKHPDYEHPTYAEYTATFPQGADREAARRRCPTICRARSSFWITPAAACLRWWAGRDFEHNQYDRALQGPASGRNSDDAFFVFAAAFEKGMFPGSVVEDSALDNRAVMIGGTTGILGEWGPESAEKPLRRANHSARGTLEIEKKWRDPCAWG